MRNGQLANVFKRQLINTSTVVDNTPVELASSNAIVSHLEPGSPTIGLERSPGCRHRVLRLSEACPPGYAASSTAGNGARSRVWRASSSACTSLAGEC